MVSGLVQDALLSCCITVTGYTMGIHWLSWAEAIILSTALLILATNVSALADTTKRTDVIDFTFPPPLRSPFFSEAVSLWDISGLTYHVRCVTGDIFQKVSKIPLS